MGDVAGRKPGEVGCLSAVARQGIMDSNRQIVAYELLYRRSQESTEANVVDDMAATVTVVINTLSEIGLEVVVGARDIYINCSADVLSLPLEELLPVDRVVLEILETVTVTAALLARIQVLRAVGFRIAIDDFLLNDARQLLFGSADIIKVDLMAAENEDLQAVVDSLSGFDGLLLAEKVEDAQDFERCVRLGFDLYQGYFFCRPKVMTKRAAQPNRGSVLATLAEMQRADMTLDAAAALIQQDLAVSYRLLQCLNSVVFALRRPVESLRQALVLLGMPRVRAWISLMALSSVGDKPSELIRMAMIRATMCQNLAKKIDGLDPEMMFTVGLFSMLDALLDMNIEEALVQLPLGEGAKGALLGSTGIEGEVLTAVVAHERGDFDSAWCTGLTSTEVGESWVEAVAWAEQTASALLA